MSCTFWPDQLWRAVQHVAITNVSHKLLSDRSCAAGWAAGKNLWKTQASSASEGPSLALQVFVNHVPAIRLSGSHRPLTSDLCASACSLNHRTINAGASSGYLCSPWWMNVTMGVPVLDG